MPEFELNQQSQSEISDLVEEWFALAPEIMGISESIAGCEVTNVDTYGVGVGVFPRYVTVRIYEYTVPVFYRGSPGIVLTDLVTVLHFREGNRYEIIGISGSGGAVQPGSAAGQWLDVRTVAGVPFMDFEPDLPAVVTAAGIVTEHATIVAAIAAAAATDAVVIPPGTYDETFSQKSGVYIVELFPGTVIINSTSANTAVTTVNGGYIKVKEIRTTRANNNIRAVLSSHATGVAIVLAELIRAENVGTGDVYTVDHSGAGTLRIWANRIQSEGGDSECTAVRVPNGGGPGYIWCPQILSRDGTGSWTVGASIRNGATGPLYIWGECRAEGDDYAIGAFCDDGIMEVWGDCYAITDVANSDAFGAYLGGGDLQTIHGNCIAEAVDEAYGAYAYAGAEAGGVKQIIYGHCSGTVTSPTGTSVGAYCRERNTISQSVWGNAFATGGAASAGAWTDAFFGDVALTQRVNGDVTGDHFGARCEIGTQTITNGRASGGTADLNQTGGLLQIHSVEHYVTSGAIAVVGHTGVNNYAVAAGAITILPNAAGDIASILTALYAVAESAGGTSGGTAVVMPGGSVNIYNDGVDVLALAVAAAGSVTLQRTAGAATFDVSLQMVWI